VALKALAAAVEGPAYVSAAIPLVVEGYSGKVNVEVYDRWGSLVARKEVEVLSGEPFQVRVALPRGTTTAKVRVTTEAGEVLLDQDVPVTVTAGAALEASWLGGSQVVKGWEVVGGASVPTTAMPAEYRELLQRYQDLYQKYQELQAQAGSAEDLQLLLSLLQQLEAESETYGDLAAKIQDLEKKIEQLLQQAASS